MADYSLNSKQLKKYSYDALKGVKVFFFYQVIKHVLQTNSNKYNRVKIKQNTHTIKLVNTRHGTHHSQALIMGNKNQDLA